MKTIGCIIAIMIGLLLQPAMSEDKVVEKKVTKTEKKAEKKAEKKDDAKAAQKAELLKLLTSLKVKAAEAKEKKDDVAIPVATAGARGSQVAKGSRFAPKWPDSQVSPLHALSQNIQKSLEKGDAWTAMKLQMLDFVDSYPEYKDEPLLKELEKLLSVKN